jgi:hypothetical protein
MASMFSPPTSGLVQLRINSYRATLFLFAFLLLLSSTKLGLASSVSTHVLPDGKVGASYSVSVPANNSDYSYRVIAGALPPGLSLDSQLGSVEGIPTTSGTFDFTVLASNTVSQAQRDFSIKIAASGSQPTISVTPTSSSVTSQASVQFAAMISNFPTTAVTWAASQGSISAAGFFTAPTVASASSVIVTATSVADPTQTTTATVTVNPATSSFTILTSALPAAPLNSAYSTTLSASGGKAPYSWSITSGTSPSGIWLSHIGVLSGATMLMGQFPLGLQVRDATGLTLSRTLVLTVKPPSAGQGFTIPAGFFGMHINHPNTPWPTNPIGSVRLWDTNTGWDQVETAQGTYDWSLLDSRVNQALAAGADVLYNLGRTPGWAKCSSSNSACGSGVPVTCSYDDQSAGLIGQCYPPNDLNTSGHGSNQHWIDWVTAVATRYRGRIKYYETWNEPDIAGMWQGTNAQLVRMEQDAHCIVIGVGCNSESHYNMTGIDTSALITTPGFASTSGVTAAKAVSGFLAAGGGAYADVIAFHGYLRPGQDAEQVFNVTAAVQNALSAVGLQAKPIFDTEGSWGTKTPFTDPDQLQSWAARYLIAQQSAGTKRFYWYSWDAGANSLWSSTNGTTPGGIAFAQVSRWLTGSTLSTPCANIGTVWTCSYNKPGGYQSQLVWDTAQTCSGGSCSTSTFKASSAFLYAEDLNGTKSAINPTSVRIGLKPILLENR